jgi:TMEM175 potassium channel family protein
MESLFAGRQHQKDTSRVEAFSDGVFCVALTLLAIEIGVEAKGTETNRGLADTLFHLWPKFLAYGISFINVLLAWMGHHGLCRNLRNTDNRVMISNGFLLLLIALVPLPTKTLGLFLMSGAFKTAVIFYTSYFVLISIAFRLIWYSACTGKDLLVHYITPKQIRHIARNENLGLICNCVIVAVSFLSPWMGLILSFLMWVYWLAFAKT